MSSIGEKLRQAREAKGATCSKAAAATRIKIQHIEAMERDDFDAMPAPAYARGFIRLYASYLGLDARPMVEEYDLRHGSARTETLKPIEPPAQPRVDFEKLAAYRDALLNRLRTLPRPPPGRTLGAVALAVLLVWLTAMAARGLRVRRERRMPALPELLREPPQPFLDEDAAHVGS